MERGQNLRTGLRREVMWSAQSKTVTFVASISVLITLAASERRTPDTSWRLISDIYRFLEIVSRRLLLVIITVTSITALRYGTLRPCNLETLLQTASTSCLLPSSHTKLTPLTPNEKLKGMGSFLPLHFDVSPVLSLHGTVLLLKLLLESEDGKI